MLADVAVLSSFDSGACLSASPIILSVALIIFSTALVMFSDARAMFSEALGVSLLLLFSY